jgi:ParB family chromosome partitioning protein
LLQNLVVVPEMKDGKRTGRAAVTAGETRRLALCLLRDGKVPDAGGFDDEYPVPVLEVASEEATAASASENMHRTQMHPADQFDAFTKLYEQCGSIEHVAAMFNVSPLSVRQRLKLAAASPSLFEEFRNDGMTLEQLMALCVSDDHDAQERVWKATKGRDWERQPSRLREVLTAGEVPSTSPLAQFVSVAAYEEAGGIVRRDLFSTDDEGSMVDSALLTKLAEAKLEKQAAALRAEGWSWVEVRARVTQSYEISYTHASKGMRRLTDDERTKLAALEAEHDEADRAENALYEKGEDNLTDDEQAQLRTLNQVMDRARKALTKLRDSLSAWTPEVMAHAGALVTIDPGAKMVTTRGLVRPQDRKAAAKAAAPAAKPSGDGAQGDSPKEEPKAGVSESLMRRLTAHRTVALQLMLADNTQVALAALAHSLVQRVLDDEVSYRAISSLDLQARGCDHQLDAATESSFKTTRAWLELQGLREQWGERRPGDQAKLLPWLIALPQSELCDLLALCVALTVNTVQPSAIPHSSDALAAAVGLDMADWWEPTADEYLSRVPKALISQALSEASLTADAAAIDKLKKGEAVAKAEALLSGKRWLPAALKARAVA